jgi:apolipoprotein N-acyltransferase
MNRTTKSNFLVKITHLPADRLAWLWLLIGLSLLPFTFFQTVIPLAAWLAPVFLLRFARTARRTWVALSLIFVAYAVGISVALRGSDSSSVTLFIFGIVVFPLIRGLMYTLPYAADRLIGGRASSWARALVFPLAFTSVDWLMSLSKVINSTGSPAYSQYDSLVLMQILSITGMWGITFLMMWFASAVNALWEHAFDCRPVRGVVRAFAITLLVVLLFGSARLIFFPPSSPRVRVATITLDDSVSKPANNGIDWLKFNQSTDAQRAAVRPLFRATVDQLLARTETALRGGAKIVAWQEGAGMVLEEDKQSTLERVAALARAYDAFLEVSFGVPTRTQDQHFVLNESILVDDTGTVRWTYDKTFPVIPTESFAVIPGDGNLPYARTPYGLLSTAICNDLHFPPLIRQAGKNNADILIAPYNDIHPFESEDAVVAIYRAIENGFSLVRPTGHGFSTITDYEGRILASQDYFTDSSGILQNTVPLRGVTTIYSRIGDLFAYLCVAGLAFLTGWALFHRKLAAVVDQRQPAVR